MVRLFGDRRRGGDGKREAGRVQDHLAAFAGSRVGVEGFVEPETAQSGTTLVLVAADGEWTRRLTGSREEAFAIGRRLAVPVYDVQAVGYPRRMREWSARRKRGRA